VLALAKIKDCRRLMTKLKDKVALVTGGARRVGRAIAKRLGEEGAEVILHYHSSQQEAVAALREFQEAQIATRLIQANLADAVEVRQMLDRLEAEFPPVDILVNSASVYYGTPLEECTLDHWENTLNTNLRAPFQLAQRLGLLMKHRGSGDILNIVDCAIRRPYKGFAPYLMSKAALMSMTEVLALELAPEVRVNAIAPGTVLLPENTSEEVRQQTIRRAPLKRLGVPEDVADMACYLVSHSQFMTGGYYAVDGGAGIR